MPSTAIEAPAKPRMGLVLAASSTGTVFEWYDFFIFGSPAPLIAKHFFASAGATQGSIFALLTFAAGFAVRPFGALVFGRVGDRSGRKRAFLVTITIMGLATVAVGLLPDYRAIGIAAPYALVSLRVLQGFAIGGQYGGGGCFFGGKTRAPHPGAAPGGEEGAGPFWGGVGGGGILLLRPRFGGGGVQKMAWGGSLLLFSA